MPGQIKTKGTKKLLMSKKIRTRAFLEEDATGTATAGPLGPQGCQKLKKDYIAGPSVSRPRRITCTIKSC
jgi:hypothetical protein